MKRCLKTPPRDFEYESSCNSITKGNKDEEEEEEEEEEEDDDNAPDMLEEWEEIDEKKDDKPYFEKQQWEMCLLHSLNALYQETKFSSKDMDEICKKLAPNKIINPHKSIFQTGNYDANVLMSALENNGVDVQWFDSRKAKTDLKLDDSFLCPSDKYDKFLGFILNNPHKRMIVFNRRHWLTIKCINGIWYNLDSRQKKPTKYASKKEIEQLQEWLIDAVANNDAQLMICRIKQQKNNNNNERKKKKKKKKKKNPQLLQTPQSPSTPRASKSTNVRSPKAYKRRTKSWDV